MNKTTNPAQWIDLACSVCKTVIATVSAPLPDVPVKCAQCSRAATCASWCTDGTGHRGEYFDADRVCWGRDVVIPLTLETPTHPQQMPACEITPHRRWGGSDSVYLACPGGDLDMTVSEARRIATTLLQVADQVEAEKTTVPGSTEGAQA
ncbi:DUF6907 domain-containing protein [Nocardia araoensis]|uniref:DUF6907 domain-containing protein n=1 Tax=Nocardia araoensis TaxID=228600 RepID=UPI00031DB075|nr:hypothetical protein [Nocardia araoensis]